MKTRLYAALSLTGGFLVAMITWGLCAVTQLLPNPLEMSLFLGAVFGLTLYPVLIWSEKRREKIYQSFEASLSTPFFCKINGNVTLKKGVKNGNLYFCEGGIVIALLNEKPTFLEIIPKEEIAAFQFDGAYLVIHTVDGYSFTVTSAEVEALRKILIQKEWILQ